MLTTIGLVLGLVVLVVAFFAVAHWTVKRFHNGDVFGWWIGQDVCSALFQAIVAVVVTLLGGKDGGSSGGDF